MNIQDTVAYVRLLIGDPEGVLFTSEQVEVMLTAEGHPKLAAAQLIDRIAGSELLLSKKITTQDLSTDGPAVAKELRELAATLRRQHAEERADSAWAIGSWNTSRLAPHQPPEATEWPW